MCGFTHAARRALPEAIRRRALGYTVCGIVLLRSFLHHFDCRMRRLSRAVQEIVVIAVDSC